uniref:Uncharacterized protein n=1 Tax=Ditylenchus dipsaci TaxID=166011 RepID=A0A915DXI6_9BILA
MDPLVRYKDEECTGETLAQNSNSFEVGLAGEDLRLLFAPPSLCLIVPSALFFGGRAGVMGDEVGKSLPFSNERVLIPSLLDWIATLAGERAAQFNFNSLLKPSQMSRRTVSELFSAIEQLLLQNNLYYG